MEDFEPPNTVSVELATADHTHLSAPTTDEAAESYDIDSDCSTPFVSAPSSPGRGFDAGYGGGGGYFYSAPASPMHYVLSKSSARSSGFVPSPSEALETAISGCGSFEFDFSSRFAASYNVTAAAEVGSMSSADELFLNGQIRPLKLSAHHQRSQVLAPLVDDDFGKGVGKVEETDLDLRGENVFRYRDLRLWNKSLRRRTKSLAPMRNTTSFDWSELLVEGEDEEERLGQRAKVVSISQINGDCASIGNETTPSASASSSRCSSAGRSSKRWVFLKDFLRSKSEGRSNHKFWTNISFSPGKENKSSAYQHSEPVISSKKKKARKETAKKSPSTAAGVGKRRVQLSAHELHYTANRARAEEMRKKTYLPYRQGLLGCLGFSSKSYGAMNGFARTLNPVSSR